MTPDEKAPETANVVVWDNGCSIDGHSGTCGFAPEPLPVRDGVVVSAIKDGLRFDWMRKGIGQGVIFLSARNGKLVTDSPQSDGFIIGILVEALSEKSTDIRV